MLKYLSENIPLCSDGTPAQQLQKYFLCCEKYFRLHLESRRLYANLIISPPKHLKESIEKLRKPLRIMNSTFLQNVISHLSLYDNLRTEETLSYLSNVGRFFWNIIEQYQANETELEWDSFLSITEKIPEMMLFGVASKV